MAHNLQLNKAGKAEMAFVGATPWHGLGQALAKGATIEQWREAAGFDWEAKAAVLNTPHDGGVFFNDYKGLYRSDTKAALSVVGADYQVVQPAEVLEFFRSMTEDNGWYIHTAGVILGGKKLWAMASRDQSAKVVAKDLIQHHILLATSLDGSMKTTIKDTAVRVVCNNTFTMALNGKGREIRVSHRTAFDADAVKRKLGFADSTFDAFMKQATQLAEIPLTFSDGRDMLMTLLAKDQEKKAKVDLSWMNMLNPEPLVYEKEDPKDPRSVSRILELFDGEGRGANLKGSKGTRWGLFNAVTEHVDYEMGRSEDNRLDNAWFGRGDNLKTDAWNLLTA